jgi:hypothetical protein
VALEFDKFKLRHYPASSSLVASLFSG